MTTVNSIPDPLTEAELWDRLYLGPYLAPGIAEVTVETSRSVDKKKAKGSSGITLTDNGANASKVSITIRALRKDGDALVTFLNNVDPRFNSAKTPLSIDHPQAALARIDNIYIEKVTYARYTTMGGWQVKIDAFEWFPEPKTPKPGPKKGGSGGGSGTGTGTVTLDEVVITPPDPQETEAAATSAGVAFQKAVNDWLAAPAPKGPYPNPSDYYDF